MSILVARRGSLGGGAREFGPLSIGWTAAWWAEGDEFVALGLSDGASVSSWPDEVGLLDATQGSAGLRPTYRASVAALNSRPAIDADLGDYLQTANMSTVRSQPTCIAVIGSMGATTASGVKVLVDGNDSTNRQQIFAGTGASDPWNLYSGTTITGGTQDSDPHLFVANFGTTDTLEVDGTTVASGDAGSRSIDGLTLFDYNAGGLGTDGDVAFVGFMDRALTAQEKANLLAWSQDHYATP